MAHGRGHGHAWAMAMAYPWAMGHGHGPHMVPIWSPYGIHTIPLFFEGFGRRRITPGGQTLHFTFLEALGILKWIHCDSADSPETVSGPQNRPWGPHARSKMTVVSKQTRSNY